MSNTANLPDPSHSSPKKRMADEAVSGIPRLATSSKKNVVDAANNNSNDKKGFTSRVVNYIEESFEKTTPEHFGKAKNKAQTRSKSFNYPSSQLGDSLDQLIILSLTIYEMVKQLLWYGLILFLEIVRACLIVMWSFFRPYGKYVYMTMKNVKNVINLNIK